MAANSGLKVPIKVSNNKSQRHLRDAGLSYFRHMFKAWVFAWLCYKCSIKAIVHSIFPRWFQNTSEEIEEWLI